MVAGAGSSAEGNVSRASGPATGGRTFRLSGTRRRPIPGAPGPGAAPSALRDRRPAPARAAPPRIRPPEFGRLPSGLRGDPEPAGQALRLLRRIADEIEFRICGPPVDEVQRAQVPFGPPGDLEVRTNPDFPESRAFPLAMTNRPRPRGRIRTFDPSVGPTPRRRPELIGQSSDLSVLFLPVLKARGAGRPPVTDDRGPVDDQRPDLFQDLQGI